MHKWKFAVVTALALVVMAFVSYKLKPEIEEVSYITPMCNLDDTDTLLVKGNWKGRQAGYVNMEEFLALAQSSQYFEGYSTRRDSVTFKANTSNLFFGMDSMLFRYKELGISIGKDRMSFTAHVLDSNDVNYIYIPYHILVSLATVVQPED